MRFRSFLAPAVLGLASVAPAQPFALTHQMLPPDRDPSYALALGDVDGDGDLDAILGLPLRLYSNDGNGILSQVAPSLVPGLSTYTLALSLGDVDGDGDLDVYLANWAQDNLWQNVGGGVFADVTTTNLPLSGGATSSVALGDVDGDGDLDAYLGEFTPGNALVAQNLLHLNDGTGVFTDVTATNLPTLLDGTMAVALGDVDGDGDLDAFVGDTGFTAGGQNQLQLNDGTGVFTDATSTNLPIQVGNTWYIALGDVDGDGDLDAFLGNDGQDRLQLNNGTGVFTDVTATNLPALTDRTTWVALGDVDGDGDLDALAGNQAAGSWGPPGQNRLYLNGGTGVFADATATNLPVLPDNTLGVALGDLDGDADLDAIAVNQITVVSVWGGPVQPGHRLLLNGGSGVFAEVSAMNLPAVLDQTTAAALGDVDGDGDLDAFVGDFTLQEHLYLNGGTGLFTDVSATNIPSLLGITRDIALGDVNGDGDLDALLAKYNNDPFGPGLAQTRLYVNGGAGVFTDATWSLPAVGETEPTLAVALGDVDGDGDLDTLLGKAQSCLGCGGGQDRLFLNNGAGAFTNATATNLPALLGDTRAVALGDVDGDGDLDAYLGRWGPIPAVVGQDRLYRNGGTGVFTDATAGNLPALATSTQDVALGDVDGDGDLDAFVGDWPLCVFAFQPCPLGQDRLYVNGGTGVFTDVTATNLPAVLDRTYAVALGDVDEDGDLDALLGNGYSSYQNRLYLNAGTGVFADVTAANLPALLGDARAIVLGDVDGDGDLDAYVGNYEQQDRVYTNLARQLAWRGIPRAGKPLTLDLWGPGGGAWLLAASPGTGSLPLPPFGTLRLDLPTMFIVAGGPLDPQGLASLTFPVPANSALLGLSLNWQAVVGPPLRFTNLEITTVTSL